MNCHDCSDPIEEVVKHNGHEYCSMSCAGLCPFCKSDDIVNARVDTGFLAGEVCYSECYTCGETWNYI